MLEDNHHERPEIWFRPSPGFPNETLSKAIRAGEVRVTPRFGVRDTLHPKGYAVGQKALLRLFAEEGSETFQASVEITGVRSKRLNDISSDDLAHAGPYEADPALVQRDLSFFERKDIAPDAPVTLIEFKYLTTA